MNWEKVDYLEILKQKAKKYSVENIFDSIILKVCFFRVNLYLYFKYSNIVKNLLLKV